MNEHELDLDGLSLEEIMKEFGSAEDPLTPAEEAASHGFRDLQELLDAMPEESEPEAPETGKAEEKTPDEAPAERPEAVSDEAGEGTEPSSGKKTEAAVNLGDTVRLDDLSDVTAAQPGPAGMYDDTARIGSIPENEDEDEGAVEFIAPPPIVFRPKSRLKELKKKLVAGPEKRYYELSEIGVGKLQIAMLLCILVVLISAGAGALYSAGLIPENRMRLMVFGQVLAMLLGGLMGSYQMLDGITDLFRGRFTTNTMLAITFAACCADSVFCLMELRVPICAAFTLEVAMSLWSTYHRRTTEMGQMDTMRKAVRLDSVIKCEDYHEGRPAFLRGEGQVEDFMDHYSEVSGPEKVQSVYSLISLIISIVIAALAAVLHSVSMGVQIFSTTLLVAVPASFFVALTRPAAVLERKLHSLGTVLCGWQGIKGLSCRAVFPLGDTDLFPTGSAKMNGVKFYGDRDPEVTIAYAAALMRANGGSLAPAFDQLLISRNGARYEAKNLQFYGNGGIGGEVCDEPVLIGSLDFLKEMGVEVPEGVQVRQAVYVSIDGDLSGLFAISYSRMKYSFNGLAALCSNRKLKSLILAEDFMVTAPFLKEKFGVSTRRMIFPAREEARALAAKQPAGDAPALALTTQEGLAPAAYAVTGARALRTACRLGLVIHILGGVLGMLIMLALAYIGSVELLTPVNVLLYQLIWMLPGLLVTLWTRTI